MRLRSKFKILSKVSLDVIESIFLKSSLNGRKEGISIYGIVFLKGGKNM